MNEPGLQSAAQTIPRPAPSPLSPGADAPVAPRIGPAKMWLILRALRPYQWAKNLLLTAPLLLAHQVHDLHRIAAVALAIACFCCCASAVYLVNDVLDVKEDRAHPTKRLRPFASGALPLRLGPVLAMALAIVAFASAAIALPQTFVAWLGLYVLLSVTYSLYFKRKLLVDVIVLAGLYTLRILAGGAAAEVEVSPWLLAFSIFLFLSLAFAKRYGELANLRRGDGATTEPREPPERDRSPGNQVRGRGYLLEDLEIIQSVGPCSGYLAVLVFAMYIYSSELVTRLYRRPLLLWLVCPLMLYWITRIWFLARRRTLSEDPVLFALTDRVSWLAAITAVVLVLLAWI